MNPEDTTLRDEPNTDTDRLTALAKGDKERTDLKPVEVSDIMRDENVYFVHGILNVESPAHGTLLRPDIDFRQKLDIALFLRPSLACSSLSESDNVDSMWSKMGILLNGGEITGVAAGDNVTQAKSLSHRTRRQETIPVPHQEEVVAAVKKIRTESDTSIQRPYNEITIADGAVAGFYVSLDPNHLDNSFGVLPQHREIHEWIEKDLQMQVFVHTGSTFTRGRFNETTSHYEPAETEPTTPSKLADIPPYTPTDEILKSHLGSLREHPPFVDFTNGLKEISCAHSYSYGRDFYETLRSETIPKNNSLRLNLGRHDQREAVWISSDTDPIQDYIAAVVRSVNRKKEDMVLYTTDGREKFIPGLQEEIRNLAFHLYGFADQAESLGDAASAERARTLAQTAVSEEDALDLVKRRIGQDGDIRMTDEDIAELHTSPTL